MMNKIFKGTFCLDYRYMFLSLGGLSSGNCEKLEKI